METLLCITIKWTAISDIATIATCIIFLISIFIIGNQLKATILSTRAVTYLGASQMLQDIDVRRSRGKIFDLYYNNPDLIRAWIAANNDNDKLKIVANWIDEIKKNNNSSTKMNDFEMLETAIEKYDTVGIMGFKGMLDLEMIVDSWGASLRRTWPIVEPFIKYRRNRGKDLRIWNEYEGLVCLAYYFEVFNAIPKKYKKRLYKIDPPLMANAKFNIEPITHDLIIDKDSKIQMFKLNKFN